MPKGSYGGSESYRLVEPLLKSSRSICIVSPYIDSYYANYLVSHARGKRIRIVSSSVSERERRTLSRKRLIWPVLPASLIGLGNLLLAFSGVLLPILVYASIAVIVLLVLMVLTSGPFDIEVRVPRGFVHAKLYIGDDYAIEGSANLTFAGMHKNVEHVSVIRDPEEVKSLQEEFWRIWSGR